MFLTFCAEAGAGGEAGHIDNLYSKLLARVPVDAAPHHAEGTPATHKHTELSHRNLQKHKLPSVQDFSDSNTGIVQLALTRNSSHTHTHASLAQRAYTALTILWIFTGWLAIHDSLHVRASGNYRAVVCSTAVKAKIKALL